MTLETTAPKDMYADMLYLANGNVGLTTALVTIKDGNGVPTALALSQTDVAIQGRKWPTGGTNGQVLTIVNGTTLGFTTPVRTVATRTGDIVLTASDIGGLHEVATSGDYNDLSNLPNLFDGSYDSLTDTPSIPDSLDDLSGNLDANKITPGTNGQILKTVGGVTTWAAESSGGAVTSVAGRTGAVVLVSSDIGGLGAFATSTDLSNATGLLALTRITPSATNGQVLTTVGGEVAWTTVSGGLTAIIEDTAPKLGGNLDTNNKTISNSLGNVSINDALDVSGVITASLAGHKLGPLTSDLGNPATVPLEVTSSGVKTKTITAQSPTGPSSRLYDIFNFRSVNCTYMFSDAAVQAGTARFIPWGTTTVNTATYLSGATVRLNNNSGNFAIVDWEVGGQNSTATKMFYGSFKVLLKNVSGTLTASIVASTYHVRDDTTWEVSVSVSGTTVSFRVRGDTGSTVTWSGHLILNGQGLTTLL